MSYSCRTHVGYLTLSDTFVCVFQLCPFLKIKKKNVGHGQDTRTRGIEYPSQNKEKIHTLNYNIVFEN